ncbi:Thioredoxin domain-containing protein [Mycena chlorophos]|uniref:Thioredoxin domain-containing protein n=1 Tax=Mycena chlorophos TaxID=658473 RepID=A0A8H6SZF9_MYCCL|nr:Thioredoxin domain-containing protein [Mycena chlorophos]
MPSNPPIYMPRTALVIPPHRPKVAQPAVDADAPTGADSPDAQSETLDADKEEDKIPDSVHQINDYEDIQRFIAESKIKSTVIQFGARHNCPGCRIIKPYWHQLAESHHPRVNFVYCDVGPDGAATNEAGVKYKITAMPAFVFLKGDLEINRVLGSNKGKLLEGVDQLTGKRRNSGGL